MTTRTTKHDYTKLDAAILAALHPSRGSVTSAAIDRDKDVKAAIEHLRQAQSDKAPFRFVDARLQALRKAGKIRHAGKGWSQVEKDGAA